MKRKNTKLSVLLALFMAVIMLLSACSSNNENPDKNNANGGEVANESNGEQAAERPVKDTLTIALEEEPPTMLPQERVKYNTTIICHDIFSKLVRENATGEYLPDLAESWENPDEYTWVFHLRKDVLWHDGQPFTAEDVLYTFQVAKEQAACASHYATLDIENTKVIDDYTISVAFTEPFASFLELLATQRGTIICKHACEEMGLDVYARQPVGTGPYKFVEWISGTSMTLERFDEYFNGPAKTKNVVYKFIADSASRVIEVETGAADLAYSIMPADAPIVEAADNMWLSTCVGVSTNRVTFNFQDDVVGGDNVKLRQALAYAIDKEALVTALYGENADVLNGVLPVSTPYAVVYDPTPYDPEKAKELLAEAGYPDGLHLEFLAQPTQEMQATAEVVAGMWKAIGVETTITLSELAPYSAEGGKLQVSVRGTNMLAADNALVLWTINYGGVFNPDDVELDGMISEAKATFGEENRVAIYKKLQDYIWDNYLGIPLYTKRTLTAVSNKVEGFVEHPLMESGVENIVVYAD